MSLAERRRIGPWALRFQYAGPTRLTVRAPLSGRIYAFERPDAVLEVDPVDAASLAGVPGLRPLRR